MCSNGWRRADVARGPGPRRGTRRGLRRSYPGATVTTTGPAYHEEMNVWRLVVVFVVLALAAPARAEEKAFDPSFVPALEKALAPMAAVKAELLKQTQRLSSAARSGGKAGSSGLKKKPRSATDFKPVLQGRPVLDAWLLQEDLTAEEKTAMRQGIESLLDMFAKEFRPNNLGSSVAIAIGLCVMIVDDVDLTEKNEKDLDQTMNDVIANQPGLLKLSAREKHAMSEQLLTLTAIALTFNSVGKESQNATTLRASVEMAKAILTVLTGQPSSLPAR